MTTGAWIEQREKTGLPCFSIDEVRTAFPDLSANVVTMSLSRYRAKGRLQAVHRGFFVVIPPHYALQGRVPDSYYVTQLMAYLKKPYYVSLLSAASLWGASHQAVMLTHLMTRLPQSSTSREKNNTLRWFYRSEIPQEFLVSKNGETAPVVYSNAELTAVDLVHWSKKIGGLSAVATVLAELREVTNFAGAADGVFRTTDVSDVQRLGYLYEVVLGDCDQGAVIYDELKKLAPTLRNVLLVTCGSKERVRRDSRWHIDVNEEIEVDDL